MLRTRPLKNLGGEIRLILGQNSAELLRLGLPQNSIYNILRKNQILGAGQGNVSGEVKVVQWGSIEAEAEGLAEFIHMRIEAKEFNLGEVLVLCPRREFGYAIRGALIRRGRDAVSFFPEEVFDGTPTDLTKCQSQQAFTLLRLLENRRDLVALRCWLGFGHATLHAKQYSHLREHCYHNLIHPLDALAQVVAGDFDLDGIDGITRRYERLCRFLSASVRKASKSSLRRDLPGQ